jgi:hypothetical protein
MAPPNSPPEAWRVNLYEFGYNEPISETDPYGLSAWSWCKAHWDDFLEWVGVLAPKISDATDAAATGLDAVRAAKGIYEAYPDIHKGANFKKHFDPSDPNAPIDPLQPAG